MRSERCHAQIAALGPGRGRGRWVLSAPAPIGERFHCPSCWAVFRNQYARCPIDGAELTELYRDPLIGSHFADRYIIESCIGEGGMGRVYRARHQRVSRRFAIKVLYGDHAIDPKMRERFAREAESASRLSHPNVISVVDFGETDKGQLYLVMDYVEGRELASVIDEEGPMAPARARRILEQLCLGLAHAHENGLIHRDFKGDNVILTGTGDDEIARIVDFGLAVMTEVPGHRLTTEGMVLGTPAFMSPEQATGEEVDQRTDLFSLGIVLYHMLAGVLPFEGSPVAIAQQNLSSDPPLIHNRVPGLAVDGYLENIARTLMAKLPSERYQSAREVIAAVAEARSRSSSATESFALAETQATTAAGFRQNAEQATARVHDRRRWRRRAVIAVAALAAGVLAFALLRDTGSGELPPVPLDHGAKPEVAVASVSASPEPDPEAPGDTSPARNTGPARAVKPADTEDAGDAGDAGDAASPGAMPRDDAGDRAPSPDRRGGGDSQAASERRDPAQPRRARRPISGTTLTALYERVGRDLARLIDRRGDTAAEPLKRIYQSIPLQDALRTPALRRDAYDKLGRLKRQIRRALNRSAKE